MSDGANMEQARDAFQTALEVETPSRSRTDNEEKKQSKVDMEDLFPRRDMDRREREGGLDAGDPASVRQARAEAKARGERILGDDDDPTPRTPREGNEEDEEDDIEDEDEPLEDEEEDGEEAEDEPEGDVEEVDLNAVVEVNIDGQPAKVTLEEAVKGYIRKETFHRRLNELQQGVTALQTARTDLDQHRQAIVERAEALNAYVEAFMPQEPNWDAIYAQDPTEGAKLERRWRTFQGQLQDLQQKRQQSALELQESQTRNLTHFAQANRMQMMQRHPEWQKEKVWKRDHDSMRRTARTVGYSDEEIGQLYDARGVEILLKASKYDRMMASKPKPVRNGFGTSSTKSRGSTPKRNGLRSFDRAEKRLNRVGTVEAAKDVFEGILDREK